MTACLTENDSQDRYQLLNYDETDESLVRKDIIFTLPENIAVNNSYKAL